MSAVSSISRMACSVSVCNPSAQKNSRCVPGFASACQARGIEINLDAFVADLIFSPAPYRCHCMASTATAMLPLVCENCESNCAIHNTYPPLKCWNCGVWVSLGTDGTDGRAVSTAAPPANSSSSADAAKAAGANASVSLVATQRQWLTPLRVSAVTHVERLCDGDTVWRIPLTPCARASDHRSPTYTRSLNGLVVLNQLAIDASA